MRLFAKASAEHVSVPHRPEHSESGTTPEATTENLKVVTKVEETMLDLSSESAQQNAIADLTTLSRVLNTYFLYGTSPKNLEKLENLLSIAKTIPVTASLLMAVPSVSKDIRSASKGRGGKSKITAAATEVLNAWKDRMIAVGASGQSPKADGEAGQNSDAEHEEGGRGNTTSSPPAYEEKADIIAVSSGADASSGGAGDQEQDHHVAAEASDRGYQVQQQEGDEGTTSSAAMDVVVEKEEDNR